MSGPSRPIDDNIEIDVVVRMEPKTEGGVSMSSLPEDLKKGKPYICPECHSDDVDETDIEEFQDCLIGKAYCIDCGAQFFQYFVYAGYTQDPRVTIKMEEIE